jgi:hypothetical protein
MSIAFTLGFTDLHIFGFDCMIPDGSKTHADGIAGESVEQRTYTVTVQNNTLQTTPSFVEFARQALDLFSVAHDEGLLHSVKIYGDSLVNRMWDGLWHDVESEEEAA